ncbi:MAG: hypothetical protein HOH19_02670 [Kordiimonadaceae bacterium]|nr:hypothetical protein [Kordiimonadaceae bacterium]
MLNLLAQEREYAEYARTQNNRKQKIFALALSFICLLLLVDNEVPVFPLHFEETLTYYNISLIFCGVFLLNWFVLKFCSYNSNTKELAIWLNIATCIVFINIISFLELLNGNGLMTLALGTIVLAVVVSSNYLVITSLIIGNNLYLYLRISELPEVNFPTSKMSIFAITTLGIIVFIIIEKQRRKVFDAQQMLSNKNDELNNALAVKSIFYGHISHELRTPLNSLLLLSQNLRKNITKNLTDQQVKHLDIIYNSGSELLGMIDGLLDLSKVDANKMVVSNEEISFQEVSEYIYSVFQPLMDEANLDFTITIDERLPITFVSDKQYLFQIIKNLLSNALKFTEKGQITVNIKQHISQDNNEEQIKISVTDTGIGIDEDMQQKVFDEFLQADRNISRKFGGTGLGLYPVRPSWTN